MGIDIDDLQLWCFSKKGNALNEKAKAELSFEKIMAMEPEVKRLYSIARMVSDDPQKPYFCANLIWYELMKPVLLRCVGWERPLKDILSTEFAYSLAYKNISEQLPDCRNCGCF